MVKLAELGAQAAGCVAKSLAAQTDMERIEWQLKARNIHAIIEIEEGLARLAERRRHNARR